MHKPMPPGPGRFLFYLGYLSIELYYPYFFNTNRNWGISAGTKIICYKRYKPQAWMLDRSLVIQIVGFGIGLAWLHCDNPNVIQDRDSGKLENITWSECNK